MGIKENIPVGYKLLHGYSNLFIFHWFSKVEINGRENIPEDSPCIILPCHQNGLIDCLTLLAVFKRPMIFFAKSSIFVNSTVSKFLTFLRIMPAYRQRDGIQQVSKNEDNFIKAVDLLKLSQPLCIMPEGGQNEKHHLYSFAKGPFRIAFYTQENLPENKTIYLLPTGIDYGHYDRMGYHLVMNIAEPIAVSAYMQNYKENPAKTLNTLKEDTYNSLSHIMLDIRSEEFYDIIYMAVYVYNYTMLKRLNLEDNQTNRLIARQSAAKHLDEIAVQFPEKLQVLADKYNSLAKENLDFVSIAGDYPRQKSVFVMFYLILLFPVFVYGILLNLFVVSATLILAPRYKGTGLSATMKFSFILLFSPVNHLLFAIIAGVIFSSWLIPILIFITGLPLTVFCAKYIRKLRVLKNKMSLNKYKKQIYDIFEEIDKLF